MNHRDEIFKSVVMVTALSSAYETLVALVCLPNQCSDTLLE